MRKTTWKVVKPILDKIDAKIPLTLDECRLLQNSDYSRFRVPGGELTPEEVFELYK